MLNLQWPILDTVPAANKDCEKADELFLTLSRADDLIQEESEVVQLALKRLSPKESYERVYRMRRATQLSLQHKLLPNSEWTKPEEDKPYLMPLIQEIEAELKEKDSLDSLEVIRKH